MIFYLAAPFFNPEQVGTVYAVETAIVAAGFELLSPRRRRPTLKDLRPEERKKAARSVFDTNCNDIITCDAVLAVIDDRDPGTIWEMGFAYAKAKDIYSYTAHDYGVNVMLSGCIRGHAKGIEKLTEMLRCVKNGDSMEKFTLEAAT